MKAVAFAFAMALIAPLALAVEFSVPPNPLVDFEIDPFPRHPPDELGLSADQVRSSYIGIIGEVFGADVRARMIAGPPHFDVYGQYAVALTERAGAYGVRYIHDTTRLSVGFHVTWASKGSCETSIEPARAARILEVWTRMLEAGKPQAEARPYIKPEFYFAALRDNEELNGTSVNPDEDTATRLLVGIANDMARYCRTANWRYGSPVSWWFAIQIDRQVAALQERLQ